MSLIMFMNDVGEPLEQGDVVIIGQNRTLRYYGADNGIPVPEVDLTETACDTRVLGIVSSVFTELRQEETEGPEPQAKSKSGKSQSKKSAMPRQAYTPEEMQQLDHATVGQDQIGWLATQGLFPVCKVDADIAPISVGDLLTTSPTRGHAQKVIDPAKAVGAILGKALGSLKKGKGKIPVILLLH